MKFNRVLVAEEVLGLRGDPMTRLWYERMHAQMAYEPGKRGFGYQFDSTTMDKTVVNDLAITLKYRIERAPIFHIGKDFTQALSHIDREIPVDLIQKPFFCYLSFPEQALFDGTHWVQGCFLFIGPGHQTTAPASDWDVTTLWATYHTVGSQLQKRAITSILMPLENAKFEDLHNRVTQYLGTMTYDPTVFRTCLNAAMYVNSLGPDLNHIPPDRELKPKDRKQARQSGGLVNQCTLPVTFVSWNYKKPKRHLVDSAWVDTFLRWQRCGPGFSQAKLVWVKAHERKYKQEDQ